MPDLISIAEVALRTGRGYARVRDDLLKGHLRGQRTDRGRLLIERESAEEYIRDVKLEGRQVSRRRRELASAPQPAA